MALRLLSMALGTKGAAPNGSKPSPAPARNMSGKMPAMVYRPIGR
jgi:hypothetical protein